MKITVGVKSLKEAEYFFANGAEEVYCGLRHLPDSRLPRDLSGCAANAPR